MHAFLIVGTGELLDKRIEEIVANHNAKQVNQLLQKIEDVREITQFISLSFNEKIAMVIGNIDKASIAAQNAFLKPLEEPQKNIIYILTTTSVDSVIPTILSRVEIIQLTNTQKVDKKNSEIAHFFDKNAAEQLVYLTKLKKRDDALHFLEQLLLFVHTKLTEKAEWLIIAQEAEVARRSIAANGNIAIHLTRFAVNIN